MMSPTQRALKALRTEGFLAQIVEKWNPHAKIRQDLFGIIDIVAVKPGVILGVQATSRSNGANRVTKAMTTPALWNWLEAGGVFEVWDFGKMGAAGKLKKWTIRRQRLVMNHDGTVDVKQQDGTYAAQAE